MSIGAEETLGDQRNELYDGAAALYTGISINSRGKVGWNIRWSVLRNAVGCPLTRRDRVPLRRPSRI